MKDYFTASLVLHEKLQGKIGIYPKMSVSTRDDLSLVYSPGVAEHSRRIAEDPSLVWKYTMKSNMVGTELKVVINGAGAAAVARLLRCTDDDADQCIPVREVIVNNVFAFPGIFRGALNTRAPQITAKMRLAAAYAIAACVEAVHPERIMPNALNERIAYKVAEAVQATAEASS